MKSSESPLPGHARVTQIRVLKTGNIYYQDITNEDGSGMIKWWVDGVQETQVKGQSKWMMSLDADAFFTNFSSTDFPGLEWIDSATYCGHQKYQGKEFLVLRINLQTDITEDGLISSKPRLASTNTPNSIEVTVLLDETTRLPVQCITPTETRIYEYLSAPASMLVPPEEVSRLVAAWKARSGWLTRPAPLP